MKAKWMNLFTVLLACVLAACIPKKPDPAEDGATLPPARRGEYGEAQHLVERAIADLQGRLGVSAQDVAVQEVVKTEFLDASLGVPEPGVMYAQVITPGYVIRLAVDEALYEYHGAQDRVVLAGQGQKQVIHVPGDDVPKDDVPGNDPGKVVSIEGVQVTAERVTVSGRSVLPDGTCVLTKLLADGTPQTWWPMDACAAVQGGAWQAVVSLGQAGAPERLDASVFYEVHAWRKDDPGTKVMFPFDLAGPPMPPLSNDEPVYTE